MKHRSILLSVALLVCVTSGQTQQAPPAPAKPIPIKIPSSIAAPVAPPRVVASLGSKISAEDMQAALDFHNAKRKEVGAPPLTWSPDLAAAAQRWADHLATDKNCDLEHSTNNKYGENLFGGSGKAYTALDASSSWYSEIADFHPGPLTDANWAKVGHYTQMVWSKTQRVGIAQSFCANGATVITAEYDPPGNYMGQAPY